MASLTYDFVDYNEYPYGIFPLIPTPITTATSPVLVTLTTNGYFPIYNPEIDVDGTLGVSIEGFNLGTLFDANPDNDLFDHSVESVPDSSHGPIRANIPTDVWAAIVADGVIKVDFDLGVDAAEHSSRNSYIQLDFLWRPAFEMIFGSGDDDIIGATGGPASIHAGGGNDYITGSAFEDQILGDDGNDVIFGAEGNDRVVGNAGNDEVSGGDGNDSVLGASGNDSLYGDNGNDKVYGGDGLDTLYAGNGDDLVWGDADRDWLYGDDGVDRLWGGTGNDVLFGGKGTDYLWGGDGNDDLMGEAGNNHLFGGAGADRFIFQTAKDKETQHVYDFNRSEGDTLLYSQGWNEVIDAVGIRAGKDGSVVTINDTTIVLSGVFDLTLEDIQFVRGDDYPYL